MSETHNEIPELGDGAFDNIRALVQAETGIHLRDSKRILVSNRLRSRLRALGLQTYDDYYDLLMDPRRGSDEISSFIDAISTNETHFFRGENQLDALRLKILPELFRKRQRLSIWSAACATGEEPYSILIAADACAQDNQWTGSVHVIATDISESALAVAREAVYNERALRGMPEAFQTPYLEKRDDGRYAVPERLRSRVTFARNNLLKDEPPNAPIDIIFCRNALMYFTRDTQRSIVTNSFAPALADDGYLFIGSSESFVGMKTPFEYAGIKNCQIYRKIPQGSRDS